jgi:pimeloyl-ACP methyl ester carboxylesterase
MDTSFVFDLLALEGIGSINVLLTNNSGRANVTISRAGAPPAYCKTGSAFERFEECVSDIRSWVDLAHEFSTGAVALMGHSLGASKVTHYVAVTNDKRVRGLVLASPADVTGGFVAKVGPERFKGFLRMAQEFAAAGRPDVLMPDNCTIGLLGHAISAATFLDRFTADAAADTFDFFGRKSGRAFHDLSKIPLPILVLYAKAGELVGPCGVQDAIALLKRSARQAASFDVGVVDGGHWYHGHEREAMGIILDWLHRRVGD